MKKVRFRDFLAANKGFIVSLILLVFLPIGLLGLAYGLSPDNFDFQTLDLANSLMVVFLVALSIELIFAIIFLVTYREREKREQIKQELKIEESGSLFGTASKETENGLFDSAMRKVVEKKNFVLMTRTEIIEFCKTLNYNLETQVELRQYDDSPDNISAGNRIYCFLYEQHGIIKLTVKNSSFYINNLKTEHPHVEQVAKVSDWFEILLDDTFTDNQQVKDILINSYEHVVGTSYSLINGVYVDKGEFANTDDEVEQVVVQSVKEPDEHVEAILTKKEKLSKLTLTTREAISDYVEENVKGDNIPYVVRRKGFALYSLRAQNAVKKAQQEKLEMRSYGLLYEREKVVKMLLRFDPEYARVKMKVHPTLVRAKFPKGKDWYSIILDETFDEDVKISELIWESYKYLCEEYFK